METIMGMATISAMAILVVSTVKNWPQNKPTTNQKQTKNKPTTNQKKTKEQPFKKFFYFLLFKNIIQKYYSNNIIQTILFNIIICFIIMI